MSTPASSLHHHIRRMAGRDPHEAHRVATPLELLFDLTFVTAFSLASSQLAHALAEGHYAAALIGFGLPASRSAGRGSISPGFPPPMTPTIGSSASSPWCR
ncbi:low temperature requirement protein A [Mesorhizobium sp. M0029]|uniref:low temperature requirement protein A n=1 Tax=Mesorhizobium sp. M0029 TaxID=2956850 RepID=UPI0033383C81